MSVMYRLAVCGWDAQSPALLDRLSARAALHPACVGSSRAADLVRARAATALPCFQHVLEMARVAEYDAILIDGEDHPAEIATLAAERGAALIVHGARLNGATLAAIVRATRRHGAPLVVLRPALRTAGYAFVSGMIASEPRSRPRFVHLELRGPSSAAELLRDAIAGVARLMSQSPHTATAVIGGTAGDPQVLAAQLTLPSDAAASVVARTASDGGLSITVAAPHSSIELSPLDDATRIDVITHDGTRQTSHLRDDDALDIEAVHVAAVLAGGGNDDLQSTSREAATLLAVERAIESGAPQAIAPTAGVSTLRLLEGGGRVSPRTGRLTLVGG